MKSSVFIQIMMMASVALVGLTAYVPPSSAAEQVSVEVLVIEASRDGDRVDPRLRDIASTLGVTFSSYTNFRQVSVNDFTLAPGRSGKVSLPGGRDATLTFNGTAGRLVKLGLSIAGQGSTTLRVSKGSTFLRSAARHRGGLLILAIRAH